MQLQTFYDSGILFVDSLIRILKNNLDPAGSGSVIIIKNFNFTALQRQSAIIRQVYTDNLITPA